MTDNTVKLTFKVGKIVSSVQRQCNLCGWTDYNNFSINKRTGNLYNRCDLCRDSVSKAKKGSLPTTSGIRGKCDG